ncbi:MAG TPA: hypothetical protein VN622_07790 [Clostridia bacterium]|nr:hypothetical protein [Clostridia bacterium]
MATTRLYKVLTVYAVLAVLEWTTLTDEAIPFGGNFEASPRKLALTILAVLVVLTLMAFWKERARARLESSDSGTN